MRLRDVLKLRKGDDIVLKHDLGGGAVLHVSHVREFKAEPIIGRYPMIQYTDAETQTKTKDGRLRFLLDLDGQLVDREMSPKVLKAQEAYHKKRHKGPRRATPKST